MAEPHTTPSMLERIFGCFHRWGTWETGTGVRVGLLTGGKEEPCMMQGRSCLKCGKRQVEII